MRTDNKQARLLIGTQRGIVTTDLSKTEVLLELTAPADAKADDFHAPGKPVGVTAILEQGETIWIGTTIGLARCDQLGKKLEWLWYSK